MLKRLIWLPGLDRYRDVGTLVLRLSVAGVLIYGTQDNVFHAEHMLAFRGFLDQNGFLLPLASPYLSAFSPFICGLLILVGLLTRWAALVMVINFVVALAMVHVGLPFSANMAPLLMLGGSVFLLFHGSGRMSVDARLRASRLSDAGTASRGLHA